MIWWARLRWIQKWIRQNDENEAHIVRLLEWTPRTLEQTLDGFEQNPFCMCLRFEDLVFNIDNVVL